MTTALLLVDLQNDYFPGGKMELSGIETAAENTAAVLESFRKRNYPVIHIQHFSRKPGATFFLPETTGVEIHEKVAPKTSETVISKNFPNSFRDTKLETVLRDLGVKDLVVCGAMTHMCIDSTVRAAFDLGFNCAVAGDCCATRDLPAPDGSTVNALHVQNAFLAALGSVFARICSGTEVCQS